MAGSIGGATAGIGSIGGFASIGGDAGAASRSLAAATPTAFSAQPQSAAAATSSRAANAQVSTSFDATTESHLAMVGASGGNQPYGAGSLERRKQQELPLPMRPSTDMLAQIVAAYSANRM